MPDRLAELRRQRALVQEHLAWLEREIAATESAGGKIAAEVRPAIPASPLPRPSASPAPITPPSPPSDASIDKLLEQYRSAPGSVKQDVRKGCLLYFALALAVFAASVAVLYFLLGPK